MEGPSVFITEQETLDKYKCHICGKKFRAPALLRRHKERKTLCLIREVAPEQLDNSNRCIFCNKIFSRKDNLVKHHKTCKIKNGGVELLTDSVRYEQEIRILKEKDRQREKEFDQLHTQFEELKQQITHPQANNEAVKPFNIVSNTSAANSITINKYGTPSGKHILGDTTDLGTTNLLETPFTKLFKEKGVQTPICLVPVLWFNKEVPQNYSIYLKNRAAKDLLVFDGNEWLTERIDIVVKVVRDKVYDITTKLCHRLRPHLSENDAYAVDNIDTNWYDSEETCSDYKQIIEEFIRGHGVVESSMPKHMRAK